MAELHKFSQFLCSYQLMIGRYMVDSLAHYEPSVLCKTIKIGVDDRGTKH